MPRGTLDSILNNVGHQPATPAAGLKLLLQFAVLGLALIQTSCERSESISVSAAASMQDAMTEIATGYETETHCHLNFTFGSSGQLATQIKNGAPVDAFVSADQKEVDDLKNSNLLDNGIQQRSVVGNELVLIVPANSPGRWVGFDQLKDPQIRRIAIGEPETVPAGRYAMQILKNLKLDKDLAARLVYGSNVRQVLDYVQRGEVDAGIVYATDAKQAGRSVRVVACAPAGTHAAVIFPVVVIKSSSHQAAARSFIDYLLKEKSQSILVAHGFVRCN